LIDDRRHPDAKYGPKRQTGGLYDAIPVAPHEPCEAGQVHHSRLVVKGRHVEHWLNGAKVVEYELESPTLMEAKAASKFKAVDGWGTKFPTQILLQDHGDEIWFRSVRIRRL